MLPEVLRLYLRNCNSTRSLSFVGDHDARCVTQFYRLVGNAEAKVRLWQPHTPTQHTCTAFTNVRANVPAEPGVFRALKLKLSL